MNILLIQPKMKKRPMDTDLKIQMSPSLALLTLVTLTPDEHAVTIVNENLEEIDHDCGADLVGITVTLDVLPRATRIAAKFRERGVPVVAGGIHITCSPGDYASYFDAICIGPAERVWAKIIRDAEKGGLKKEYCDMIDFRGGEIVSPAYDRVEKKHYLSANVVLTSRGCPNRCSFCYNSCQNRLYIRRPIPDVVRDIRGLGARRIFFIDDNFIGDPKYTNELLSELQDMNLVWGAAVTTDILEYPDLLDRMAETGCQSLFIGFESINPASLRNVNKSNVVERYEALVEAIHRRGMMINASMVFGLDGDDAGTFERSLDWLIQMRIETLTSHILTPYPGTELYRSMTAAGRILDHDLEKYNTANVVFAPADMTAQELYAGYRRMYREFYSIRNILRRFPKNKKQRKAHLVFNLFYRKFGPLTAALARVVPMGALGRLMEKISYRI